MAEVGVQRPAGQDQIVIGEDAEVGDDFFLVEMHVGHFPLEHFDVGELREDAADRLGDFRGAQAGRGDLVEQRLEQVMVAAIEQRDLDVPRIAERLCRGKSAETAANNEHACHGTNLPHACNVVAESI